MLRFLQNLFAGDPDRPAWADDYEALKALGSKLATSLPIQADYYQHLPVKVDIVFAGRDVNGAIDRFNAENGTEIKHNPKNHTFFWAAGPDWAGAGYSPRNRYVVFLVGDEKLWDRVGLADEMGHVAQGERSHWLGE